ncbi:serine/threonine-protein kinase [Nocardia sp. NPDC059240]|uniref:serine/threonine-protein kinase n=1 Tax=Nocardia sp. NPDC059240 TaxID=3346786 RepID=UPI0036ACA7FE
MSFRPGTVFEGYRIERLLGTGGMGSVYLARHPRLPRLVALKVLLDETGGELRRRFVREATLIAALEHPNIVHIHDYSGPDGDALWISMRYVAGGDMADLLAREGGRLAADRAVRLIAQAARGLDHAHRHRILHRDVKPLNLLMDRDGDEERVVVTDFGIARMLDATRSTKSAPMTYAYAAPERFDSQAVIDHRSDVYSLGCTLYELLTGKKPYPASDLAAIMGAHLTATPPRPSKQLSELPAGLDSVIATALAKRPADRFGSCLDMAAAAQTALVGWSAGPRDPAGTPRRIPRPGTTAKESAGKLFAGYRLRQQLSKNPQWSVYSAWHPQVPGLLAVKIGCQDERPKHESHRQFVHELDRVRQLDHPNIARVHDHSRIGDRTLWVAARYIPGGNSLQSLLDKEGGHLAADHAVWLCRQIAEGLDHAHRRGIVHRRIVPSNILLESDGDQERPVIINFGSGLLPDVTNPRTGELPPLPWAAPEVLSGNDIDSRTDIYYLGCTLYRMLVGRPPFRGDRLPTLVRSHLAASPPRPSQQLWGLPVAFDQVIATALAKKPDQRYAGCLEFAAAAEQALLPPTSLG